MENRIKEFRTKLNIIKEELARLAKVRRETIVFLEQGQIQSVLKIRS